MNTYEAMCKAAELKLQALIAADVEVARCELGLPVRDQLVRDALDDERALSPLFVSAVLDRTGQVYELPAYSTLADVHQFAAAVGCEPWALRDQFGRAVQDLNALVA
jgi:hypothetical protein